MTEQRCRLVLTHQARQQFRELRQSIESVSGSEVTARNYMRALTDYIEQLPDFPLRGHHRIPQDRPHRLPRDRRQRRHPLDSFDTSVQADT